MADANIRAVITADDRASRVLAGFGNATRRTAKTIAVGIGIASAAAVAFGVSAVKSFNESEQATTQLNTVLKSTKGIAGVTAKAAIGLANSLQKVTKFDDEAVLGGENLLLTFTKIGKDIFPQATEVMLDMSTALGQDLKSSAIQLGKALQDPVLGITALRRVGVNFNDEQKEVIKNLVETGRSAEAQRLILKELQVEFGGSARAAGTTFAGQLAILKNQFDEVKETVGATIVQALVPFATKAATAIASIDWKAVLDRTSNAIKVLWTQGLVPLAQNITNVVSKVVNFLKPSLSALWNTISTQLLPVLVRLWREVLAPLTPVIGKILAASVWVTINVLNVAIRVISTIIRVWLNLISVLKSFIGFARSVVSAIASIYGKLRDSGAWSAFLSGAKRALGPIGTIIGAVISLVQQLINKIREAKDLASGAGSTVKKGIVGGLRGLLPGFASGTSFAPGGPAIVGESGPEIVNLPRGSQVLPNKSISSNQTVNLHVNIGMYAGTEMEKRKIAKALFDAYNDLTKANLVGVR